jgi:hypothetical protein
MKKVITVFQMVRCWCRLVRCWCRLFRYSCRLFRYSCRLVTYTSCVTLVVVLSPSIWEAMGLSPARDTCWVKPKTFKIDSDCSFAKSTAFRSENHRSFGHDLKNAGPVSQYTWHVKEPSPLKAVNAKHRSKFVTYNVCQLVRYSCWHVRSWY